MGKGRRTLRMSTGRTRPRGTVQPSTHVDATGFHVHQRRVGCAPADKLGNRRSGELHSTLRGLCHSESGAHSLRKRRARPGAEARKASRDAFSARAESFPDCNSRDGLYKLEQSRSEVFPGDCTFFRATEVSMRRPFIPCNSRSEAVLRRLRSVAVIRVGGGFLCFESSEDYGE